MAEIMYFFDSTEEDERIYDAADFARFHHQIIGNGVSNTQDLPDLEVSAGDNMEVNLGAGYMFANGYMYGNTSTLSLEHDIANTENDRIDRVIIRFDNNPEERTIKARILKGTPDSNPTPPEITRDNYIHDMSVAQVLIKAGKSYIEDDEITDERANDEVCGYIPLHNIYRGMQINEYGMVTMPNQSYVEMDINEDIVIDSREQFNNDKYPNFYHQRYKITPSIDKQNEIQDGIFICKASGTYMFNVHTRLLSSSTMESNRKLESEIMINDDKENLLYLFNNYLTETQYIGSNMKHLNEGDKVELVIGRRYVEKIELDWLRLNIAKIN